MPGSSAARSSGTPRPERALDTTKVWGAPLQVQNEALLQYVSDLQEELVALVSDVRRGPLARVLAEGIAYLGELRREFLRGHRRLLVGLRADSPEQVLDLLRIELADLNERLRAVVLGRASRMSQEAWRPSNLVAALSRTTEVLPRTILADFEARTHAKSESDPKGRAMRRALARWGYRTRRLVGAAPKRVVPLQSLAQYHLVGIETEQLEGLAALFVQVEGQLVGHSRIVLDGIARGFEAVREHAHQPDLPEVLATFRQQVEHEFQLAEAELTRLADDGGRRTAKLLGAALCELKDELPIVGTFELRSRRRHPERRLAQQALAMEGLETRMGRVRHSVSSSYVLLGLHLEYASYRARVRVVMGRQLTELKKDVRGRSHTQVERVIAALQVVLQKLDPSASRPVEDGEAEDVAESPSVDDLRTCLEPLERALSAALRHSNQLLEQLTEEQLVAPLLDALNREAQGLTDRYDVSAGKLPHAEWRLPPPLSTVEVRLSELVSAYIQTDIAPELLRVTQAAVGVIQPLVSAFHDLERVVSIDADNFEGDGEIYEGTGSLEAPTALRDVARAALARSQIALQEVLRRSDSWSDDLVESFKKIVFTSVDALRERLSEGHVGQLRTGRSRGSGAPRALTQHADRLTSRLNVLGEQSTAWVRQFFGERRLQDWRRQLGLPGPRVGIDAASDLLALPDAHCDIPLYYRRLFSSSAQWAGDLLPAQRVATEAAKRTLLRTRGQGLRTAVVLSPDGGGQGALLAALTRGERFGQIRRISFGRPATVEELDDLFLGLSHGQLLVVGGFHWLLSVGPGGYAPLRRFLAGVLADGGKNAWVLEATSLVWRFAQKVAPASEVFRATLEAGPLNGEELEAALRSRHQLSGLQVRFSEAEVDSNVEVMARDRFFSTLHRVSRGFLGRALPLWVASITRVDEQAGYVRLGPPPASPLPVLSQLDDEACVVLLTLLRQGWMDAPTLAHAFRWTTTEAEGRLMSLLSDGLLDRLTGGLFQVRRHLRQDVQEVLRHKRWCP